MTSGKALIILSMLASTSLAAYAAEKISPEIQRARTIMECNYQAGMYAAAVQAHAMSQKENTTVGYILMYQPSQTDPEPIPAKRKFWVQTMVHLVYQNPRKHMSYGLASEAMHNWKTSCIDNPEQFTTPSMIDWTATAKRMSKLRRLTASP